MSAGFLWKVARARYRGPMQMVELATEEMILSRR